MIWLVSVRKSAINYWALLWEMTCKDEPFYGCSPHCSRIRSECAQKCAVRCSILHGGAVCCSVLRGFIAVCVPEFWTYCGSPIVHAAPVCCSVLQRVAACCGALQCVAVCCSVLQCVAVCCSVLCWQCYTLQESLRIRRPIVTNPEQWYHIYVAVRCSVLQCVAVVAV